LTSLALLIIAFALLIAASVDHSGPMPFMTSKAFIVLMAVILGAAAAIITVVLVQMLIDGPKRPAKMEEVAEVPGWTTSVATVVKRYSAR